jgi:hypothetical protein
MLVKNVVNPNSKINIHITNYIDTISKYDLYSVLATTITEGNYIQLYIYGLKDSSWIKLLEEIMDSALIKHRIILLEVDSYEDIPDRVMSTNIASNIVESFEYAIVNTTKHSITTNPILIPIKTLNELITRYNLTDLSLVKLNRKESNKYRGSKLGCLMYSELLEILKYMVGKYRPELTLTILYVDQLEKQIPDSIISKVVSHNKPILSMFDRVLHTEVISCSIFTSYDTVEHLIKEHTKDKLNREIFIVLDTINRSLSVNSNNNSYYIPIESYITTSILNTIYFIILNNILK